jgi:hypothetical protein
MSITVDEYNGFRAEQDRGIDVKQKAVFKDIRPIGSGHWGACVSFEDNSFQDKVFTSIKDAQAFLDSFEDRKDEESEV